MDEREPTIPEEMLPENAMRHWAETTEVSTDHARELLERYGGDYELARGARRGTSRRGNEAGT